MKKRTHYPHSTAFRFGEDTNSQIEKLKEFTKCKSTTKVIRKAIEHYYAWEMVTSSLEEGK